MAIPSSKYVVFGTTPQACRCRARFQGLTANYARDVRFQHEILSVSIDSSYGSSASTYNVVGVVVVVFTAAFDQVP